jgi:uncharacterized protein YndB with AHSA1/START domain
MDVNRGAPVVEAAEIHVEAAPDTVWDVLADIRGWPGWNPDVRSATVDGEVAEGTAFRWKSGPGTIASVLRLVDRPRALGWTGSTLGIRAVHVWHLEPRDGGTFVRTQESFEGALVRLLRGSMQKTLRGSLERMIGSLKSEAERRSGP